jgi:hypothetical protein
MKAVLVIAARQLAAAHRTLGAGADLPPLDRLDQAQRYGTLVLDAMRKAFPAVQFTLDVVIDGDTNTQVILSETPRGWGEVADNEFSGRFQDIAAEVFDGKHGHWWDAPPARRYEIGDKVT